MQTVYTSALLDPQPPRIALICSRFPFLYKASTPLTLSLLLLLGACQSTTPVLEPVIDPQPLPETTGATENPSESQLAEVLHDSKLPDGSIEKLAQADALARTGYYRRAADLYTQLAFAAEGQQQASLLLKSAELYDLGQQPDQVLALFATLEPGMLSAEQMQQMQIHVSSAQLQRKEYYKSLLTLPKLEQIETRKWLNRAIELRSKGMLSIGNPLEALNLRINNESQLTEAEAIRNNHQFIWTALKRLPEKTLLLLLQEPQGMGLRGWLELELIARRSGMLPTQMGPWVELWLERYTAHPAADQFADNLLQESRSLFIDPTHIAVLLPQSGKLKAVADAIRNGIIYAHFEATRGQQSGPTLRFVDSSKLQDDLFTTYSELAEIGVDLIIGPLDKERLQQLANHPELPILTLALNRAENAKRAPVQLYQFGLSPEDEAVQAAEMALQDNHHFAIALTPKNRWGERMATAFKRHFEFHGGHLLNAEGFLSNSNDHAQAIKKILDISASESRRGLIQRVLGRPVEFQPRRRQDVDAVFLAANKRQALQIKPQLKFFRGGDLPVYSTSHLSPATTVPGSDDKDLNGIRYVDMPWALDSDNLEEHAEILRLWPRESRQFSRLFALGIDSYRIASSLRRLQRDPDGQRQGLTGTLSVNSQGLVIRELQSARIVRGKPRKLTP